MAWHESGHFNFGGGIYRVTSPDDPKFPDNAIFEGLNMVYDKESDNPQTMHGNTQLGSTAMGGTVTGLFDHNSGDKLLAAATDGKIYQYDGSDWVAESGARATGNSRVASARWSGTMFYGATTTANLSILANDDPDAPDVPVKFDGSDATTLGGSPPAAGKFPVAWQGKCWLFQADTAFGSANENAEEWSTGAVNIQIYRGYDGNITGAATFGNNLFIFKRSSIFRIAPTDSFSTLSIVKNVSTKVGCVSHQTIQEDENGLWFESEHGLQRIRQSSGSTGFTIDNMSRWVKPIFDGQNRAVQNTSFAIYNFDRNEYFFEFATGSKPTPSRGLIANMATDNRSARWTQFDKQNLTCGTMFVESNTDYNQYVGDTAGKVWLMHDPTKITWNGSVLTSRFQSKYYVQGLPQHMKRYGWAYANVESNLTTAVDMRMNLLRRGLPSFGGNVERLAGLSGSDGWGVGEWGVALWGGSGPAGVRVRPSYAQRGTGMQVLLESDQHFKIQGVVIASAMRSSKIAA